MDKQFGSNPIPKNLGFVPGLQGTPELSPDLVWLLGNESVEAGRCASALLTEYEKPFFQLALAYLDQREAAQAAVQESFVQALAEAPHFSSKTDIAAWFFRLAIQRLLSIRRRLLIQRRFRKRQPCGSSADPKDGMEAALWLGFDELGGKRRMALLLRALFGWELKEIATVMDEEPGRVRQHIEKAEKHLLRMAGPLGNLTVELPEEGFSMHIDQALRRRWEPGAGRENETKLRTILDQLEKRKRSKKVMICLKQGAILGLPLILILVIMLSTRWNEPADQLRLLINPPTPMPTLAPRLHYSLGDGDRLVVIAALLHTPLDRIAEANHLQESYLYRGKDLLIPARPEEWLEPSPTPLPVNTLLPRPLSDRSTVKDVLARMKASASLWHTAWMDIYYLNLGPAGYAGPPQQSHIQVWVSQPGKQFIVYHYPSTQEITSSLVRDGLLFEFNDPMIQIYGDVSGEGEPLAGFWIDFREDGALDRPEAWKLLGMETQAGRPAIVLDWKPEGQEYISGESVFIRYWVDALTGTTLRQQIFIQNDDPVLLMDFFAQQAFFDIDLPAAVFNPFQAIYLGISKDYLATPIDPKALKAQAEKMKQLANVPGHEQYERRGPPPGFDPAEAALIFRLESEVSWTDNEGQPAALFAGRYFLAELPNIHPWNTLCTRSEDGRKIAYTNPRLVEKTELRSPAGWIDLHHPGQVNEFIGTERVNELAFSPDGRYLAYTETNFSIYGDVYILDTETGETYKLNDFEAALSLAWSPDGKELALITVLNQQYTALVAEVETGEIIYSVPIETVFVWDAADKPVDWPASDWPGHAWGIQFPARMKGLDGCYWP